MTSEVAWCSFNSPQQALSLGMSGSLGVIGFDRGIEKIFRSRYFKNEIYIQKELKNLNFIFKKENPFRLGIHLTSLIIFRPVAEEIVFRGMIREQAIAYQKTQGKDPDSLVSQLSRSFFNASLFAIVHLKPSENLRNNVRMGIPIFFSGIIYSGLTELTGNIWPAAIAHSINNGYSISKFKIAKAKTFQDLL